MDHVRPARRRAAFAVSVRGTRSGQGERAKRHPGRRVLIKRRSSRSKLTSVELVPPRTMPPRAGGRASAAAPSGSVDPDELARMAKASFEKMNLSGEEQGECVHATAAQRAARAVEEGDARRRPRLVARSPRPASRAAPHHSIASFPA